MGDTQNILQTIYIDDAEPLEAVALEEASGRIAVCDSKNVYVYRPLGKDEDVLRVRRSTGLEAVSADSRLVVSVMSVPG